MNDMRGGGWTTIGDDTQIYPFASIGQAPQDLKFAAAVAEFGMILRDSEYKGNGTLGKVLEWAQEGKGSDANGYRAEFIELVRKAQALKRG